jgi:hypothetical protein
MHTNYDQLARLRMEEHEAGARQRRLQRIAREARRHKTGAPARHHGWLLALRRLIAVRLATVRRTRDARRAPSLPAKAA